MLQGKLGTAYKCMKDDDGDKCDHNYDDFG